MFKRFGARKWNKLALVGRATKLENFFIQVMIDEILVSKSEYILYLYEAKDKRTDWNRW